MIIWKLHGICYREMAMVAKLLAELAEKGEVFGVEFDLDTLEIHFNEHTGDVDLVDGLGNTTAEEEEGDIQEIPDLAEYLPADNETAELVSKTVPPTQCVIQKGAK